MMLRRYPQLAVLSAAQALYWSCSIIGIALTAVVGQRLAPSPLESFEALEQLRALWHGYRINVWVSDHMPVPGVDTPEDALSMQAWFAKNA